MCRFREKAKTWGSLPVWWKMAKFCSGAATHSPLENTFISTGRKLLLLWRLVIVNLAFAARTEQLNLQVNPWFTLFLTSFRQKNTGSWLMLEKHQVSLERFLKVKERNWSVTKCEDESRIRQNWLTALNWNKANGMFNDMQANLLGKKSWVHFYCSLHQQSWVCCSSKKKKKVRTKSHRHKQNIIIIFAILKTAFKFPVCQSKQ